MKDSHYFADVDKTISKQILREFTGEVIDEICPTCRGERGRTTKDGVSGNQGFVPCEDCQGAGFVSVEY
jgi:hypothetical protein